MEYTEDTALSQLLLRKKLVEIDGLTRCAAIQRREQRSGKKARFIGDILVSEDLISRATLDQALRNRSSGDSSRLRRLRSGESSRLKASTSRLRSGESSRLKAAKKSSGRQRQRDPLADVASIGPFQIMDRIAAGGMGAIYKAIDRITGSTVALKVLQKTGPSDADSDRFLREARIACSLDHPGLVRGLSFGNHEGTPFFAMEYIEGESLRERLNKHGALPQRVAADIILRVARALVFVHGQGMIHRDLKPDNILLGEGIVKLCDLGLAREIGMGTTITQSGQTLGTPRYISPEQARGEKDIDLRTDIYSLGITFFHMLTGKPPFPDASGIVVMSRHLYEEVPLIRSHDETLSRRLERIVWRMTQKARAERYNDADELIKDLIDYARSSREASGRRRNGRAA